MSALTTNRLVRAAAGLAAIVVLLVVGTQSGPYQAQIASLAAIYVILASSLNLLLGYSGLLSLGHQAFFGLGAYVSAILTTEVGMPMVLGMVGAAVGGLVAGLVLGKITLRLRAAFFVIATFAVGEMGRQVALNWVSMTGGPMGLSGIPPIGIGPFEFIEPELVYPAVFVVALVTVLFVARLARSGLGYSLRGLAENENLARAVGIDTARHANLAFMVGGAMAAVAGSLYAHSVGFVSPEVFSFSVMINTLLMVIGGGLGTVLGPVVGAIIFTQLPEALRFSDEWRLVAFGLILVLVVRFLPRGLWGSLTLYAGAWRTAQRRKRSPEPDAEAAETEPAPARPRDEEGVTR
jgi:branched-chain amino acid transport system permease protein